MKCTAHLRDGSGKPCRKNAKKGMNVCASHGGAAPQTIKAAQLRLLMAADSIAGILVEIAQDSKMPPATRVAAARDILDRAGLKPVEQVEVTTVDSDVVDLEIRRLLRELDKLLQPSGKHGL